MKKHVLVIYVNPNVEPQILEYSANRVAAVIDDLSHSPNVEGYKFLD